MKYNFLLLTLLLISNITQGNTKYSDDTYYSNAFESIHSMLKSEKPLGFRQTVFEVENAWYEGNLRENYLDDNVEFFSKLCTGIIESGDILYSERDKNVAMMQCAVFLFMTDTTRIHYDEEVLLFFPFQYNYEDYAGQKDWSNMFVSSLIETGRGNCHSMPYLYKMIMDELGYESHLALAPNHIYVKVNNKAYGWYNIELTSGKFPTDAWFMASSFIHTDAVRNGMYMKALSDRESVALCLIDLAQGYQAKYGIGDGEFILRCCHTALEYFPNYINALLLKSEILSYLYQDSPEQNQQAFAELTELVTYIHELGYRRMPQQMYENWLSSLNSQHTNNRVNSIIVKDN